MQTRQYLLKFFNIRQHEAWLVTQLLGFQFFSGITLAVFFTVASTTFLKSHPATDLPNVYLTAALLLWLAGYIYAKAEHIFSLKTILYGITVLTALSCVFFWKMSFVQHTFTQGIYFFFAWYNVLYLLLNLGFWALAALSFDVRQSKRLFSFISAGDIPSKMIGYASISVLAAYFPDIHDLLLIAFGSMILAFFFLHRLNRAGKLHFHHEHKEEHEHEHEEKAVTIKSTILGFFDNQLITMIAGVSLVVVVSSTLITYVFYSEVKHEIYANTNTQLAAFIGLFMASGRGMALLVKLLLTSRINNKFGILGSLLISPTIMLLLVILTFLVPYFRDTHALFYFYGIMALVIEVLRATIQDPALLSLFQPLKTDLRLRGHTIVKGIMDPFALLVSALLLFLFNAILPEHNGLLIFGAVLLCIIIWLVLVWMINRAYFSALETALHNRYDLGRDLRIDNAHTVKMLMERMMHGEAGEAIYILELFQKEKSDVLAEILLAALKHENEVVTLAALKGIMAHKVLKALPSVKEMAHNSASNAIKAQAIETVCMLQPEEIEEMTPYLDHEDELIMRRSITGHLRSGGIEAVVISGQKLLSLIHQPEASKRVIAAKIIGNIGLINFYKPIEELLLDPDFEVTKEAIIAAGKIRNEKLMPLLIKKLEGEHYALAQEALIKIGKSSINLLNTALQTYKEEKTCKRIIFTLSKIHHTDSYRVLLANVSLHPALQSFILYCLYNADYSVKENTPILQECLDTYLKIAEFLKNALPHISQTTILANAIEEELHILKNNLLNIFGLLYDNRKIAKARYGFTTGKKEGIANAFEILDLLLPKETASRFSAIYEENTQPRRMNLPPFQLEPFLKAMFKESDYRFLSWTKAVLMTEYPLYFVNSFKDKASIEQDPLLSDTFEYLQEHMILQDNGGWEISNNKIALDHKQKEGDVGLSNKKSTTNKWTKEKP